MKEFNGTPWNTLYSALGLIMSIVSCHVSTLYIVVLRWYMSNVFNAINKSLVLKIIINHVGGAAV